MAWKAIVKRVTDRIGLTAIARDVYRTTGQTLNVARRQRNATFRLRGAPDDLPLPPEAMIYAVAGHRDYQTFWIDGAAHARNIRHLMSDFAVDLSQAGDMLDFGCGCGRVLRHWTDFKGPRLFGSDYNEALVAWCQTQLPFAHVLRNELDPPLPFEGGAFDVIYALSVFTHLDATRQVPWIREINRVLRPGGTALLTVHGDRSADLLSPSERAEFALGKLVVQGGGFAGENACSAFHPSRYIEDVFGQEFAVLGIVRSPLRGSVQDAAILRKR